MKYTFLPSLLLCCLYTGQLFGDTKAFEQAVSQYCKGGKTAVLAQKVLDATRGWKLKDYSAANTFTLRYYCVKKTLEAFLAELRNLAPAPVPAPLPAPAVIPVAPPVPAIPMAPYVRPIPVAPGVPVIPAAPYVRPIPVAPAAPILTAAEQQAAADEAARMGRAIEGIPEAPAVPELEQTQYQRPLPAPRPAVITVTPSTAETPEIASTKKGVPERAAIQKEAPSRLAPKKQADQMIEQLKKATADSIDALASQAQAITGLTPPSQASLKQAIQDAYSRIAKDVAEQTEKEAQELAVKQLQAHAHRAMTTISTLLKTPWDIALPDKQWNNLVNYVQQQIAPIQELVQVLDEAHLDTEVKDLNDSLTRIKNRLADTQQERIALQKKQAQEQEAQRLEKQAQTLLSTFAKTTEIKQVQALIDQASELAKERNLTATTKAALNQAIARALTPTVLETQKTEQSAGQIKKTKAAPSRLAPKKQADQMIEQLKKATAETIDDLTNEAQAITGLTPPSQAELKQAIQDAYSRIAKDVAVQTEKQAQDLKRKEQIDRETKELALIQAKIGSIKDAESKEFSANVQDLGALAKKVAAEAQDQQSVAYNKLLKEIELEKKVADFAMTLTQLRLALNEDNIKKISQSIIAFLATNSIIDWRTLNAAETKVLLDKLITQENNFESALEPQLERLSFKPSSEKFFVLAMRRAVETINEALNKRRKSVVS
jgi:hypothetical protein